MSCNVSLFSAIAFVPVRCAVGFPLCAIFVSMFGSYRGNCFRSHYIPTLYALKCLNALGGFGGFGCYCSAVLGVGFNIVLFSAYCAEVVMLCFIVRPGLAPYVMCGYSEVCGCYFNSCVFIGIKLSAAAFVMCLCAVCCAGFGNFENECKLCPSAKVGKGRIDNISADCAMLVIILCCFAAGNMCSIAVLIAVVGHGAVCVFALMPMIILVIGVFCAPLMTCFAVNIVNCIGFAAAVIAFSCFCAVI